MQKEYITKYDKDDKQLVKESLEVIAKVFGKQNDGLDEYKRMSIYNIYKERFLAGGLQQHHYEEVLTKMKPIILASKDMDLLEDNLRNGIEAFKKQKWKSIFAKLEAFRNA